MILITDSQMRQALVCIRSLGKRGLEIVAGDCEKISMGFYSKYVHRNFVYPDPNEDEKGFVKSILEFIKIKDVEFIIPIRDKCLLPLLKNRKRIEKYTKILSPDAKKVSLVDDKSKILDFANRLGISTPIKYDVKNIEDLKKIKKFPIIIKPAKGSGSRGLIRCYNQEELIKGYEKCKAEYSDLVIQEMIPLEGKEIGFYALYNYESKLIASSIHERIRSFPILGGPSTIRISIRNKEIENYGKKILDKLKWVGPAMVEFKVDPKTNTPKLIEINPRLWGSLGLDIASGVDYPVLMNNILSKNKIETKIDYRVGVKSRWLFPGDMLWFLKSKKSWENIKSFFKFKGYHYDVWSRDDPMPTIGVFIVALSYLFNKKKLNYVFKRK